MNRKYDLISPPDSALPAAVCGSALGRSPASDHPIFASLASVDLAAEAAMLEACQVSAMLAAAAMSLTSLTPETMPRLLRRP
jgi:hypothetical protein